MRDDPILDAFLFLNRRDGSAPLVAGRKAAATRGHIDGLAGAVATLLPDGGAVGGTYALVAAVNGAGFLAALLGARRAGLIPVLADAASPAAERSRIAAALRVSVRIECDEAFPDNPSAFRIRREDPEPAEAEGGAGYVKLTSGSSGSPSGVAMTAEALASDDDQLASTMELRPSDRFVAAIPWSHSYGLSSLVMPALRRGSLLIVPQDAGPWAPLEAALRSAATVFPTVPVYLQTIASLSAPPAWPESLQRVISAGAPLHPETAERFSKTFGRCAHVFYGASECGGITYDREGHAALRGTVGAPVDGVDVTLDEDGGVIVRSAGAGIGLAVFRSADLGAWTESGELRLIGRADTLINVGGKKVQPAEVETVLRAMPGVREAYVLGLPGKGDERTVVRAVVACDPASVSYADVASWCRERLAVHKVPRSIVRLREIPRTARGKIDRAALAGFRSDPER